MQYNFNIEIPKSLIFEESDKQNSFNSSLIEHKIVLGLLGYAKSGKDFISKNFTKKYGFNRIAFADNVKKDMNLFMKELVYEDLSKTSKVKFSDIDFNTEDEILKKLLRPYIIWYAETLRELNGKYYWINKALQIDADGFDRIVITDIRRKEELEIFKNSNSFVKKTNSNFILSGIGEGFPQSELNSYSTLLFHVSQFQLTDSDVLTQECIRIAQENWMIDFNFYVDSRLPEMGNSRNKSINIQIYKVAKKFGISLPDKTIAVGRQCRLF